MGWMFYTASGVAKTGEFIGTDIPVGTVVSYTQNTAPSGWLLCDGSAVSRSLYSDLFNVIGTSYGSGDGSSTFNVPDSTGDIISHETLANKVAGIYGSGGSSDAADSSYALFIGC